MFVNCSNVIWSTEQCEIYDNDLHSLLFGHQLSDRTITCWMFLLQKQYPLMKWQGENILWDFLPANLSRSFEGKNTNFLRRLVPGKDLEVFAKAKLIFVPLNLGDEWHWHLLAIDYKSKAFHFYDSNIPRGGEVTRPANTQEMRKIDISRFVCAVLEAELGHPSADNFNVHFYRDVSQQMPESISCGMYVCIFLKSLLTGMPLQFSWEYMMLQRAFIASEMLKQVDDQ